MTQTRPRSRAAVLWIAPLLLAAGCVSRTLSVRSEPAGARVILDGRFVGTTPYDEPIESYGTRGLELQLPGYARRHEQLPVPLPWWQVFPLDLITDLLLPLGLHDDHLFSFVLQPLDPEAGTWEDARAAYAREQAALDQARRTEGGPADPAGGER